MVIKVRTLGKFCDKRFRGGFDICPCHIEAIIVAIIRICNSLSFPAFDSVEQQHDLGSRISGPHMLDMSEIILIEREYMSEAGEIIPCDLPRRIVAYVYAPSQRCRLRTRVRRIADMP